MIKWPVTNWYFASGGPGDAAPRHPRQGRVPLEPNGGFGGTGFEIVHRGFYGQFSTLKSSYGFHLKFLGLPFSITYLPISVRNDDETTIVIFPFSHNIESYTHRLDLCLFVHTFHLKFSGLPFSIIYLPISEPDDDQTTIVIFPFFHNVQSFGEHSFVPAC